MVRHPASPRQILRCRCVEFIDVLVATNLQIVPFMAIFMLAQVRPGNVIERKDENQACTTLSHSFMYQMVVELRDVDSGSKVNERLRTDEPVQKIFVQEKSFTYLYTDDETGNIVLMEPKTYSQLEVPRHLFGESLVYLQDDMEVTVQLYDERPLSVKIPHRVTCTVTEAAEALRGSGPTAYKKVLLDNGLTVQVPAHILAGDKIVINTTDNSYASRIFVKFCPNWFNCKEQVMPKVSCLQLVVSLTDFEKLMRCYVFSFKVFRGDEAEALKPDGIDSMNQVLCLLVSNPQWLQSFTHLASKKCTVLVFSLNRHNDCTRGGNIKLKEIEITKEVTATEYSFRSFIIEQIMDGYKQRQRMQI
ncbi:UNVERIFIED_CONTAM: Elongation factor P [Sesamum angustifolium]|uniref:Elongation factor P n=1 Tax=Sesamum angustifolium TaxID=2727405 RepID=A0AAW2QPE4_9LAMI